MVKAKAKKEIGKGRKKAARQGVLKASTLGVAVEHLLPLTPATAGGPALCPPVECAPCMPEQVKKWFSTPLLSPRTSFWLGVGIGIVIIAVLGYLAWRLYNVEIAEALVLNLPFEES